MGFFLGVLLVTLCASGFSFPDPSTKVIGGQDAQENEFPGIVSVQWAKTTTFEHICGGSILSATWIVTAGHCITEPPKGFFRIVAGITDIDDRKHAQKIKVDQAIVHPEYNGGDNDIALLKLSLRLAMSERVKPVRLPTAGYLATGIATIAGWGLTKSPEENSELPNKLQTTPLPIISLQECAAALVAISGISEPLADTNICTGPLEGGKGGCSGDSGGPLLQGDILIGLASWTSLPCGGPGIPTVWTQTSSFIDFIKEHVKNLPNL